MVPDVIARLKRKASFWVVRTIAPTLLMKVKVRFAVAPVPSIVRPVPVFSIVPELVITTPVDAPFQFTVAVPLVERSVPPAFTVPVCVPLRVFVTVSVAPGATVKVCASAAIGANSAATTTLIVSRLAPLRHSHISPNLSPRKVKAH